ncbi:potassium transporter Trk [Agromyces bauzanensis]
MSDTQNSPETPEPISAAGVGGDGTPQVPATPAEPMETEVTSDAVMVRRAPRYGRFITLGALVGAVVALILTFAFSGEPPEGQLVEFDKGQVFGFLLLICATLGAALGAIVALVIDRAFARRAAAAIAEHESTHRVDE